MTKTEMKLQYRTGSTRKGRVVQIDALEEVWEDGRLQGWLGYAYIESTEHVSRTWIPNGDVR